jgi:hypothetical protein
MFLSNFVYSTVIAVRNAKSVAKQGIKVMRGDIAVVVYAVFTFLLVLMTIPLINGLLLALANSLSHESIFEAEHHAAKIVFVAAATFISAICVAMLLSYFTCVVAASTLSQLQGHPAPLLKGLKLFGVRFRHITKFALVSVAFIPIGFLAQRSKFAKVSVNKAENRAKVEVIGSSLSLSMAQLAPVILSEDKEVYETIQHSINILGKAWREGLVIKVSTYITILFLTLMIGLVPTLVQALFFTSTFSQAMGQFITVLLIICLLITTKVLGTVFTTTLYWRSITEQDRKR